MVHAPHSPNGQRALNNGVKKLHKAPAVALLHRVQVIGKQAHEGAHLVHLVVFPAQGLGVAEHLVPQVRLHLGGGTENGGPPGKPAQDNGQHDIHHGHTDFVQQIVHVKGDFHAALQDISLVHAVDHRPVNARDQQLQVVHRKQGQKSC